MDPLEPHATDRTESPDPAEPVRREELVDGLRFVHLVETVGRARVAELSATLNALIEVLVGEGHLPLEAFDKRRRLTVLRENDRGEGEPAVQIADIPDKYAVPSAPIDCEARLPLCKARCCTQPFLLSVQDLDEGAVRWEYGRPYRIARRDDGYCAHNEGGLCAVHELRPGACRAYDCRRDRRIWIDFEQRIPAP